MNKKPKLKPGEASIIARFNTMNGAVFSFRGRGVLEEVAEDFLNQAKAAGHNLKSWEKKPLIQLEEHLKNKRKKLDEEMGLFFE